MNTQNTFRFTRSAIKNRPIPDKRTRWHDEGQAGLILDVTPSGKMTFRVYKWFKQSPINVTIGPYPTTTIEQARKETAKVLAQMVSGANPNEQKKQTRKKSLTFGQLFSQYMDDFKANIKNGSRRQNSFDDHDKTWRNHIVSVLGQKQIHTLSQADAKSFLNSIKQSKSYAIHNKVLTLLKALLNFGLRQELVESNVFDGIKKMSDVKRERFLQKHEIKPFFDALAEETQWVQDLVKVLLFTGQRKHCVFSMEWNELNLESGTWTIPTTKMKAKKPHTVALSIQVLEILNRRFSDRDTSTPFVFPSSGTKSGHVTEKSGEGSFWRRVTKRAGLWSEDKTKRLTMHDLRRTLGSWQAIQGVDINSISKSLGHSDIRITSDIYAHLNVENVRSNIDNTISAMTSEHTQSDEQCIDNLLIAKIKSLSPDEKIKLLESLG